MIKLEGRIRPDLKIASLERRKSSRFSNELPVEYWQFNNNIKVYAVSQAVLNIRFL